MIQNHPKFTIYPAIDLRKGQVVRLRQGDPDRQTIYSNAPVEITQTWLKAGSKWLHVVNLDGAFEEDANPNLNTLKTISKLAAKMNANLQFGGGLRSLKQIKAALDLGVTRVILGTMAVHQPDLVAQAVSQFGSAAIGAGIDAWNGNVKIRGWLESASLSPLELARRMAAIGVRTLVYTNIKRDGVGTGVDVATALAMLKTTDLTVIASGGVATLEDIERVKASGLQGVIIGRALYEGHIDLKEALAC